MGAKPLLYFDVAMVQSHAQFGFSSPIEGVIAPAHNDYKFFCGQCAEGTDCSR